MTQEVEVYELVGWMEDGEPRFDPPYTLDCRWVDAEGEGTLNNGDPLSARFATIEAVPVNSVVRLVGGDGRFHSAAQETSNLDIKGRTRRHEYSCSRYKGTFPEGGTGSA